jgi:hypothetical protein
MFDINKLLFGKKIKVNVSDLGVFEARIKNINKKDIIWTGSIDIEKYDDKLVIQILGNSNAPYKNQVETIQFILNNSETITNQIIEKINANETLKSKFKNQKITDYYLNNINPWLKNEVSYELSFQSKINDEDIGAIFKNRKISEINF